MISPSGRKVVTLFSCPHFTESFACSAFPSILRPDHLADHLTEATRHGALSFPSLLNDQSTDVTTWWELVKNLSTIASKLIDMTEVDRLGFRRWALFLSGLTLCRLVRITVGISQLVSG